MFKHLASHEVKLFMQLHSDQQNWFQSIWPQG